MPGCVARSRTFDLLVSLCVLWIACGFFLDAWAHGHVPIETFFTPYHGVFYGGMAALCACIGGFAVRNHRRGCSWRESLPEAYRLPLLGVPIFIAAGLGDLAWHHFLGVEEGVDALLSPTHQALGLGIFFLASGPIASSLRSRERLRSLGDQVPLILALAAWLELVHFGTAYAFDPGAARIDAPPPIAPFSRDYLTAVAIGYYKIGLGVLVVLFQSALMAGFALFTVARFRPAPGAMTLLYLLGNSAAAAAFTNGSPLLADTLIMSLAAGVTADVLVARLHPAPAKPGAYRLFAVAVPTAYFAAYAVATALSGGTWWDWNEVLGATIWAGAVGLGLSFICATPAESR